MPAKKPSKELVAFKQVSKLFKFRKNLRFFKNYAMYLIGIKESLIFKVLIK